MKQSEYLKLREKIWNTYGHAQMLSSLVLNGPACYFVKKHTKKAGIKGSRGSYVSKCIEFYEEHNRTNEWGDICTLERRITRLSKTRARLQEKVWRLQESGN